MPLLLKSKRVLKNLSQKELAQILDISTTSYKDKELGYKQFRQNEIAKLIDILEIKDEEIKEIFFTL